MTRAKVLQLGLFLLIGGPLVYQAFRFIGFEGFSAGIASQSILVLIVLGWTGSYLFRVFTGQMTFMEQRKRYRSAYDQLTDAKLKERFELLSDEEKNQLIQEVESENS